MTIVDELVRLLNHEGQKQTHRSTREIVKKTALIQRSIVQITYRNFGLNLPTRLLPIIVSFLLHFCFTR